MSVNYEWNGSFSVLRPLEAKIEASYRRKATLEQRHPNCAAVVAAILTDDVVAVQTALTIGGVFDPLYATYALNDATMAVSHVAAANGAFGVLEWVAAQPDGAEDLAARVPSNGWTPCHFAAFNGRETICAFLRSQGVDPDTPDFYGDTPCDVAGAAGHSHIVDMLGGNAAAREARQKYEDERSRLLQEARAFEEERQRAAKAAKEAEEQKKLAAQRRSERIRQAKKLRAKLEDERLNLIRRWMLSRESMERDTWSTIEWLVASHHMLTIDVVVATARANEIHAEQTTPVPVELPSEEPAVTPKAAGKKGKPAKKGAGGRKASKSAAAPGAEPEAVLPPQDTSAAAGGRSPSSFPVGSESPGGDTDRFELELANDPALQMPVITGIITKEKKKELAKLKLKIERMKRERREARAQAIAEYEEKCRVQLADAEAEEALMRDLLQVDWLLGAAKIEQNDVFRDRRHPGDYVYHSTNPPCTCGHRSCRRGTCSWTCCGEALVGTVGCAIVDDLSIAPHHPGVFSFHMEGCGCAQAEKVVVGGAKEIVRPLVDLRKGPLPDAADGSAAGPEAARGSSDDDSQDDADDDVPAAGGRRRGTDDSFRGSVNDDDVEGFLLSLHEEKAARAAAAAGGAPREVQLHDASMSASRLLHAGGYTAAGPALTTAAPGAGTATVKYCNPGGTVWSCCGAVEPDSDGCTMQSRFLHADNVLLCPCFVPSPEFARRRHTPGAFRRLVKRHAGVSGSEGAAVEATLAKFAAVEVLGGRAMMVQHAVPAPLIATPTRATVMGILHRDADAAASAAAFGPLDSRRILSFEVQILKCPAPSAEEGSERLVVGFARCDAYIGPGTHIGGPTAGIGWWSHSSSVRGLGYRFDVTEPYAAGDIICVAYDPLNHQLYFFRNRRHVGSMAFRPAAAIVPAVTLVAGCRIAVDETNTRTAASYVDEYVRERAERDRHRRLHGNAAKYRSRFRDKFELTQRREISKLGGAAEDESDDEGRINFDV